MAIDLPPAIPPQLATVEFATRKAGQGSEHTATVGNVGVTIYGNSLLSAEQIDAALAEAGTPSQAVRNLNQAYWEAGHLLVTLQYAVRDQALVVGVTEGQLADVIAPESIYPFFNGLIGDTNLTRDEFNDARLLSNMKSQRAGYDINIRYHLEPNAPENVTLIMESEAQEDHDDSGLTVTFGNPGNRFVGRYFGNVEYNHLFDTGAKLSLGWETAMTGLSDSEDLNGGLDYNRYLVSIDQPTQLGFYGLSYNQTRFGSDNGGKDETLIVDIKATGEQMVIRTDRTRISVNQAIGHIEDETAGTNTRDEQHTYLAAGASWLQKLGNFSQFLAKVEVKAGVDGDNTTGNDSKFTLIKPQFSTKLALAGSLSANLDVSGQFLEDSQSVPRQQQWVLGGMAGLSAWLPGILVGDEGYFGRAALAWTPNTTGALRFAASVFYEYGQAQDADGSTEAAISDAGVQGSLLYGNNSSLDLVVARPIEDDDIGTLSDALEADFFFMARHRF